MSEVAIDNDVLIKAACYELLDEVTEVFGGSSQAVILGAARFVVRTRIAKLLGDPHRDRVQGMFDTFLATAEEVEPTDAELELATRIEEVAAEVAIPLDSGESQLCAIVLSRNVPVLLTGDKRAIIGAEALKDRVLDLAGLSGRVVRLEQIFAGLLNSLGFAELRTKVCSAPFVDRALAICFSCSNAHAQPNSTVEGLRSYINDLRSQSGTILYAQDTFGS